jgi:general stress protein YciG
MARNDKHNKDESMTTAQAGKLGGEKVRDQRGPEFYSEIGQRQGKENNPGNFANRPKEDVKAAGRKGGEARSNHASEQEPMDIDMDM